MKPINVFFLTLGLALSFAQSTPISAQVSYKSHTARLMVGAGLGVAQGLFNTWHACRNGFTKQNPLLYRAPWAEWVSAGIGMMLAGRAFVSPLQNEPEYRCRHQGCKRLLNGPYALQFTVQGLAQMLSEVVPQSKATGKRNYALNAQLLLGLGYGVCWFVERAGVLRWAVEECGGIAHTHG